MLVAILETRKRIRAIAKGACRHTKGVREATPDLGSSQEPVGNLNPGIPGESRGNPREIPANTPPR